MSSESLFTINELKNLGLPCHFEESLYEFIKERFSYMNQQGQIEYDFQDLSIEEILDEYLDHYNWEEVWNNTVYDLVYLFLIKLFHKMGIPYNLIIKKLIGIYHGTDSEFEDIYRNDRPHLDLDCIYYLMENPDDPSELVKANSNGKIPSKYQSCLATLFLDGLEAMGNWRSEEVQKNLDIFKTYCQSIDIDALLSELEQEGLSYSLTSGILSEFAPQYQSILDELEDSYQNKEPDYQSGNNFIGSLISKVQFKYIMDAILLKEIPENYSVSSSQGEALFCHVYDRAGWYELRTINLTEGMDIYKFNPQYSIPIFIVLPTENDDEKIHISGLYHWELQLLSLDFPDGQHLIVTSPDREPFKKKDTVMMERYLQEMESENNNQPKPKVKNGMILRLRTQNNLMELLQTGQSPAWKIAQWREKKISQVQIFNWDGSLMLQASFDASKSKRTEDDKRLIVGFSTEDAQIIKCDPPLEWVGQNPVHYLDDGELEKQERETEVRRSQSDEPPTKQPSGGENISSQIAEICETVYGEPIRLIYWQLEDEGQRFTTLWRERRRGWYFEMLLTNKNEKWSSQYRVLPSFLSLLEPNETIWPELTKDATTEDWNALDEIFLNSLAFPGSEVFLAGSDLMGEEVANEAMERFGFYVPDEELLPALMFENRRLGMKLISYFKHPDGFAKENMVMDDNAKQSKVFDSLKEAQERLKQKLSYYWDEA